MIQEAFYDPLKSYYENFEEGPFGDFARSEIYQSSLSSEREFLGHMVATAFGIPAGPLLNGNYVKAALDIGFDLPIYKTVRSGEHGCHEYPNVLPVNVSGNLTIEEADAGLVTKEAYADPLSITNSFGVPSYNPDVWQEDVEDAVTHAGPRQLVGLSFQGTKWDGASSEDYIGDWVTTAKLAAETGAPYLEANLSCPNEGTTALLCFDVERVSLISRRIKEAIGDVPLLLKISYFKDDAALEALVREVGTVVEGFATINTISAEVRTPSGEQALPGDGRLRSGVCGNAIKWAGIEMVERFVNLREQHSMNYTIVGVGGITKAADHIDYLTAGADAAMSATGAMWNPQLGQQVHELLAAGQRV